MTRQGDGFEVTIGERATLGYELHAARDVNLFSIESVTFRVLHDDVAVWSEGLPLPAGGDV